MNMKTGIPTTAPTQMNRYSLTLSLRSARASSRDRFAPKSRSSTTRFSAATADDCAIRSLIGPWPVDAGFAGFLAPRRVALEARGDGRSRGRTSRCRLR